MMTHTGAKPPTLSVSIIDTGDLMHVPSVTTEGQSAHISPNIWWLILASNRLVVKSVITKEQITDCVQTIRVKSHVKFKIRTIQEALLRTTVLEYWYMRNVAKKVDASYDGSRIFICQYIVTLSVLLIYSYMSFIAFKTW